MLGDVVVSAKEVHDRVGELGRQITLDYADKPPLLVCVLKGAINFMADLMRSIAAQFVTPFDPEDLVALVFAVDDVPDAIENASELLNCPDIDGLLVGGASLDATRFFAIAHAAAIGACAVDRPCPNSWRNGVESVTLVSTALRN